MESSTQSSNSMTVARALRRIKHLKGQSSTLAGRAQQSTVWVDEDKPTFDFAEVVKERETVREELVKLKAAVARANTTTKVEFEGQARTIQELVFLMAELKAEVGFYVHLEVHKDREDVREVRNLEWDEATGERKMVKRAEHHYSALTELERVKKVDGLRERIAKLNDLLEENNHIVRL